MDGLLYERFAAKEEEGTKKCNQMLRAFAYEYRFITYSSFNNLIHVTHVQE